MTSDSFLKRREVAAQVQISERQVDHLIAAGILKSIKIGRSRRIRQSAVDELAEALEAGELVVPPPPRRPQHAPRQTGHGTRPRRTRRPPRARSGQPSDGGAR